MEMPSPVFSVPVTDVAIVGTFADEFLLLPRYVDNVRLALTYSVTTVNNRNNCVKLGQKKRCRMEKEEM